MPLRPSSSEEVLPLPSVPRRRRPALHTPPTASGRAPVPPASRSPSPSPSSPSPSASPHSPRNSSHPSATSPIPDPNPTRTRRPSKRALTSHAAPTEIHSPTPDHHMPSTVDPVPLNRPKRVSRRSVKVRRIVDDEDDDDPHHVHHPQTTTPIDHLSSEKSSSPSSSPPPPKKKGPSLLSKSFSSDTNSKPSGASDNSGLLSCASAPKLSPKSNNSSADSLGRDDDPGSDDQVSGGNEFDDVLQQLEKEADNDASDQIGSDDSEEERPAKVKGVRLTRRQRAMKGEKIDLEHTMLQSKSKKPSSPEEDWSHDEDMELKRQQKARLRQMINEKRNKEKRAATVDRVLRGVTSKRKKLTMANEARVAQVGSRLSQNEMRDGCMRFVSNKEGISLSIPKKSEGSIYLQSSMKAVYPRACTRDPRTGKRIFADI